MIPVDVYKNLHTGNYSVRSRNTNRVLFHADQIAVENVSFVVQPAGRAKVIREKRKNVHAFVRGHIDLLSMSPQHHKLGKARRVTYNPYNSLGEFYHVDTGNVATPTPIAILTKSGVWVSK